MFRRRFGRPDEGRKIPGAKRLTFLGLWGEFPGPDNDMILRISVTGHKKEKWANITHEFAAMGGGADFP